MKEEEIEKGNCGPPTRKVLFFWDFVGLEPSSTNRITYRWWWWCIRLTRLTLVCEVIRHHLVRVRQNLKRKGLFGLAARNRLSLSHPLSFSSSSYFLSFSKQKEILSTTHEKKGCCIPPKNIKTPPSKSQMRTIYQALSRLVYIAAYNFWRIFFQGNRDEILYTVIEHWEPVWGRFFFAFQLRMKPWMEIWMPQSWIALQFF